MAIDLDQPRYDQSNYIGRAKHFLTVTNPLNLLTTDAQLDEAKRVVDEYRQTKKIPAGYDEDKLWATKYLYDSAFHPDTGEKMMLIGRMSAQVPMNTIITGGMISFYRTTLATVFWQWTNQSFNAIVNYTNRSGDSPISTNQLLASYVCACGGALGTALTLNNYVKKNPGLNPVFARLVPFAAVCGANCINIPMMRSSELMQGTPVFTADGTRVGLSKKAAMVGIGLVVISRIVMTIPSMTITPMITNWVTNKGAFCKRPWMMVPFQMGLVCFCLTFATPLACAIFPQKASLPVSSMEPAIQANIKGKDEYVYFNKGL